MFFGVSAQTIVNIYFVYLILSVVVVLATSTTIFILGLRQKWAEGPIALDQDRAPSVGDRVSTIKRPATFTPALAESLADRQT